MTRRAGTWAGWGLSWVLVTGCVVEPVHDRRDSGTGGVAGTGSAGEGGTAGIGGAAGAAGETGSSGAAGFSGAAGGAGTPGSDPCGGVPPGGVCAGPSRIRVCVQPTGEGVPTVVERDCSPFEACVATSPSTAACALRPGLCTPGSSRCATSARLEVCNSVGAWEESQCPGGCTSSPVGAFCAPVGATTSYTGRLRYEARAPNDTFTDWDSSPFEANAVGFLVVSYSRDEYLDSTVTDGDGAYTVLVSSNPAPDDRLVVFAARVTPDGSALDLAVADPFLPPGEYDVFRPVPADDAGVWAWSLRLADFPSGSVATITEGAGAGAARVFDYMRYAAQVTEREFGRPGQSVVTWLGYGTSWSCGACAAPWSAAVRDLAFASQIWIPALEEDQSYWSDPVTAHELGHWAMASFGVSPGEGGRHCTGHTTLPGQAWSEGFATGFSSVLRETPRYYDKQQGSFFWFDIATRTSPMGWIRPTPGGGLLQHMDENEVAAMFRELALNPAVGRAAALRALSTPRMTVSPFARGYTRHSWQIPSGCSPKVNVFDTGISAPMFADYLDSLRCSGVPASVIDSVTRPSLYYPYPSQSPLCR